MAVYEKPALINGVEYTHSDIVLNILGFPIIGLTSIEYSNKQNIAGNYATGHLPTSVGFGSVESTATLTITKVELTNMLRLAPIGRLQNIPFFDIGVNYIPESGLFVRDRLLRCRFKGVDMSSVTNNTQIEIPLEMFVADIRFSV